MSPDADPDDSHFAALLERIARETPGLARLRYTSPHPRHVTPDLLRAHRDLDVLATHVHLPVQSGSDRLLKRMIRRYTRAEYVTRANALRATRAGMTLTTDIIVGFPGETREDFEATLSLVREMGFVGVFGFKYSPRPYTPALKLQDDVSEEEKQSRLLALFEVSESLLRDHLAAMVGTHHDVLLEGPSRPGAAQWVGRTHRNEIVHMAPIDGCGAGAMVSVEITRAHKHSLEGRIESVRAPVHAVANAPIPTFRRVALPVVSA
jgi:tRNA-2-methylthio-N6-dimethylallyladenosine synthase